jgi:hypothetical protein
MYYGSQVLFLGHIAASLLVADATGSDRATAVAGNLIPDVADKTLGDVLHKTPSRWLFHGLPTYGLLILASRLVLDERRWRGFVAGYAGHLACDLWAGGKVPWLAPLPMQKKPPKRPRWTRKRIFWVFLPEFVGAPIVFHLLRSGRSPPVRS